MTLSDPRIWYPVNRFCGITLLAAGAFMVVVAGVLLSLPVKKEWVSGVMTLTMIAWVSGMLVACWVFARRIQRRVSADSVLDEMPQELPDAQVDPSSRTSASH